MGLATLQHHTHPSVVWFDNRRHWDPLASQLENTVHVEFPKAIARCCRICKLYDSDRGQWLDFDGLATGTTRD